MIPVKRYRTAFLMRRNTVYELSSTRNEQKSSLARLVSVELPNRYMSQLGDYLGEKHRRRIKMHGKTS